MNIGVYLNKKNSEIVLISKSKTYEDLKNTFYIVTWECHNGKFPKTLIRKNNLNAFVKLGSF